jgi:hypothetical protein
VESTAVVLQLFQELPVVVVVVVVLRHQPWAQGGSLEAREVPKEVLAFHPLVEE